MSLTTKLISAAQTAAAPATINSTDAATSPGVGQLNFAGGNQQDGRVVVLNDGYNPAITYEFDNNNSVVPSPTLRPVAIGNTLQETIGNLINAINYWSPAGTFTAALGTGNQILLTNAKTGTATNVAITTTSGSLSVVGMTGATNGQFGAVVQGNFVNGVLRCQRVKDKSGLVQVGAVTGLTASVAILGRPTPTAPWFTILTLTQADWNLDANFQAAKVVTVFPEMMAVVTISAGNNKAIDVWLTE